MYGRALTGVGALSTFAIDAIMPTSCAPLIEIQPSDVLVCEGESATFTVDVTGVGLTYQWRKGVVDLVDGGNISGATTATLTIDPATILDESNDYNVVITGSFMPDEISINVSLTIDTAPIITLQPNDVTVCLGESASFTVVASGLGNTYQWRRGLIDLVDDLTISGTQTATLTIDPTTLVDEANDYNVIISGTCLPDAISNDVSLTIDTAPIITSQPNDVIVCLGESAIFTVVASGTGISYQWRRGLIDLVDDLTISGTQTATLTIDPTTLINVANDYNVVISGICLPDAISNDVSLIIDTAPIITLQPNDVTVCLGESASFTVVASGLGNTYQWRRGLIDLVDDLTISGTQTATLTIDPTALVDEANNYNVVISGTCLPDAISNDVSLTIDTAPIITLQPNDATVCLGESASFTVVASGTGISYQWRRGLVDLVDDLTISGTQTPTLTINPTSLIDEANNYNVVISGTCLPDAISNDVSLTIDTAPIITLQPNDATVCLGESASFTVVASGLGNTYQWRRGLVDLVDDLTISGTQTATLTINPTALINVANDYNVVISGTCLPDVISDNVALIANSCAVDVSVVKTASNMTPFMGEDVIFTITANNVGNTDATGVQVEDILQSGYTYISSTMTTGTYNAVSGVWDIGDLDIGSSETLTITANVNQTGDYTNTATISINEVEIDTLNNVSTIVLMPIDFFIPEGFSPNDDMVNDLFVIRGISNFPGNDFTVFNRWGNKVYSAKPYENAWDGVSTSDFNVGGGVLPVGTYFYVLNLGDGSTVFKGTIYLNN